jgi:hypothetical protein
MLSPTHKTSQAKVASADDTPYAVRMLPQVEAETRLGRVQVKVEAPTESMLRRDRKRKQVSREAEVERREKMGRKPHFLSVDDRGRPYGLGAKSWRAELNKLCCALDPSVMDVRNQPHKPMMTLKKRLASKFEYSADIDDDWLRGEIGRGVSTRRFLLMEMIRNGEEVPPGFDKDIWYKLERISADPKYKEKSQAMRHANSCRRTLGRTGPKGEMGIVEDLREQLGRSPDPDEIEDEMKRDKGYGGSSNKKRRGVSRRVESYPVVERSAQGSPRDDGGEGKEDGRGGSNATRCDVAFYDGRSGIHASNTAITDALLRDAYVQTLLKRVADLEAKGGASNHLSTPPILHAGDTPPQLPTVSEDPERHPQEIVSFLNHIRVSL